MDAQWTNPDGIDAWTEQNEQEDYQSLTGEGLFQNDVTTDNQSALQQLQDVTKGIKNANDKVAAINKAVTDLNALQNGDPVKKLEAMHSLYDSVVGLIPDMSFSVFSSQLNALLPMITQQLGLIKRGLQAADRQGIAMDSLDPTSTGYTIVYGGAWPGGQETYNYMIDVKSGMKKHQIDAIPPNETLQILKEYAPLFGLLTGHPVPSSLTSLNGFQMLFLQYTTLGQDIKNDAAIYIYQNFEIIESVLYGGGKVP